jgi:hypothetical protein
MKYNRTNRTDRLNIACKNPATWADTKMFDRNNGVLVSTPVKTPFTSVTIIKTKRLIKHKR